jgi:acyl-CoA hydrolase
VYDCITGGIIWQCWFESRTAVTIQRFWADYVVTEYGIASLMGKTWQERAGGLITVVHTGLALI